MGQGKIYSNRRKTTINIYHWIVVFEEEFRQMKILEAVECERSPDLKKSG
jgi:hypothetical protein